MSGRKSTPLRRKDDSGRPDRKHREAHASIAWYDAVSLRISEYCCDRPKSVCSISSRVNPAWLELLMTGPQTVPQLRLSRLSERAIYLARWGAVREIVDFRRFQLHARIAEEKSPGITWWQAQTFGNIFQAWVDDCNTKSFLRGNSQ